MSTLVHADFTGHLSALVVKEPAGFSFRNPGGLRVPTVLALLGFDGWQEVSPEPGEVKDAVNDRARPIRLDALDLRRVGADKTGQWEVLEP